MSTSQNTDPMKEYFCANKPQIIGIVSRDMTHVKSTRVYHYSNRLWKDGQIVEIIIGDYLLQHLTASRLTKIYYLPVEDKPPQLIVSLPISDFDYSNHRKLIQRIKRLVLLS